MRPKIKEITKVETAFKQYICTGQDKAGNTTEISVMSTSKRDAALSAKRELNSTYKNKSFVVVETKEGGIEEFEIEGDKI